MAYMRIYCGYCGQKWEVYERENWNSQQAATCPHCGKRIDGQTWAKRVIPAFCAAADANREMERDAAGYHLPKFRFDILSNRKGELYAKEN